VIVDIAYILYKDLSTQPIFFWYKRRVMVLDLLLDCGISVYSNKLVKDSPANAASDDRSVVFN